jgi:lambda family phage portal protein
MWLPRPVMRGYGDAGASQTKRAIKAFRARSGAARDDIDPYNGTLRQRSRMLFMASPIAASAIRTQRTNVIGNGLKLKCRLDAAALGMTAEQADRWERRTEAEFELWASVKRACDATGINDFYSIQQLAFQSWLMSGDCFVLFKRYPSTPLLPYSLRLYVIEADRVSTPDSVAPGGAYPFNIASAYSRGKAENGNDIFDGVEVDENGCIAAYYICNDYPDSVSAFAAGSGGARSEWRRIDAYGAESGLPNILQIMDTERPEQYRGVPYLSQVIESILQTRRYTESELDAAVVQSMFTAFIKVENDATVNPFNETDSVERRDPNDYHIGAGTVEVMNPGESVEFADPKRPNSSFGDFIRSVAEQVGAALEVPADLLMKRFDSSYSASRAALLEAWKAFKMRRAWFTSDFCQPIYEAWLCEAVARGRVVAPGFFASPSVRAAWVGAEWIGPSQGQLDPTKEITAEILAIEHGITTREQATVKLNGGSWDSNMQKLERENKQLAAARTPTDNNYQMTDNRYGNGDGDGDGR